MAILLSADALGGQVGDTFEDYVIDRVIADGKYLWDRITNANQVAGPVADEQVLGTLPAGVWTPVPSALTEVQEVATIWNSNRTQNLRFGITTRINNGVLEAHSNSTLNNLIFITQGIA